MATSDPTPADTAAASVTLSLTGPELRLATSALESYVCEFGHDEADIRAACHRLLAKLRDAGRA